MSASSVAAAKIRLGKPGQSSHGPVWRARPLPVPPPVLSQSPGSSPASGRRGRAGDCASPSAAAAAAALVAALRPSDPSRCGYDFDTEPRDILSGLVALPNFGNGNGNGNGNDAGIQSHAGVQSQSLAELPVQVVTHVHIHYHVSRAPALDTPTNNARADAGATSIVDNNESNGDRAVASECLGADFNGDEGRTGLSCAATAKTAVRDSAEELISNCKQPQPMRRPDLSHQSLAVLRARPESSSESVPQLQHPLPAQPPPQRMPHAQLQPQAQRQRHLPLQPQLQSVQKHARCAPHASQSQQPTEDLEQTMLPQVQRRDGGCGRVEAARPGRQENVREVPAALRCAGVARSCPARSRLEDTAPLRTTGEMWSRYRREMSRQRINKLSRQPRWSPLVDSAEDRKVDDLLSNLEAQNQWQQNRSELRRQFRELEGCTQASDVKRRLVGDPRLHDARDRHFIEQLKQEDIQHGRDRARVIKGVMKGCSRARHQLVQMQEMLRPLCEDVSEDRFRLLVGSAHDPSADE